MKSRSNALESLTVRYGRKQQTQPYCSVDFEMVATVTPKNGETSQDAALRAFTYCKNHVLLQMASVVPSLKGKIAGTPFDLEGIQPTHSAWSLPESVQGALVEAGYDLDEFMYFTLPQSVEDDLKPQ
jgi:hypothetical protein